MAVHVNPAHHSRVRLSNLRRHARSRIHWEFVVFVSLLAVFYAVQRIFRFEFPAQYLDLCEHSCLFVEIASFLAPGE